MNMISKVLMELDEKHSPTLNEYVVHLGDIDTNSYNMVFMQGGKPNKPHYHQHSDSLFLVIRGSGKILMDNKYINYDIGTVLKIDKTMIHQILPESDSLLLTIQIPKHIFTENGWSDTINA